MKYSKILLCFGALWASSAFPAPAPCDTLRVAFLTDIHVTPGNAQDSLFRVAVDEINASPCDIVIFGGDLTNLGSDAELEYVHGLISRLEKPWHAVPGNHETTWSESACTAFARIFGHDGRTAFRAGDYLFLGYASGPFMKMAMGAVRTEDLAWLAAEAAKARPGQRIVSLCHYPLNNDLTNRTEVTATLRRLGIPLTLFGHYHRAPSLFNFDSIAGIQGRALRGKSDSDAGYTLLDFWGDSVRVREKTLGAEPRTRFTIRMQDDPRTLALASDPTPPVPDYKAHAQLVLQDSATIYTGAAFYRDLVYYGTTQGVLRAYDKIYAKAYAEETALIDGLLLDLAKADVSEALKTLHLDTYVAQLKTLNDAYKALDITRTDEYSARVKTDTTKARKATDETLDLIIQRVNAYAVLEPTEAINAFIDTVNQIFRKYKNLIAAKGGPTSPSKSDDKPYPTPDPAPDPENPGGDSESPDEI